MPLFNTYRLQFYIQEDEPHTSCHFCLQMQSPFLRCFLKF